MMRSCRDSISTRAKSKELAVTRTELKSILRCLQRMRLELLILQRAIDQEKSKSLGLRQEDTKHLVETMMEPKALMSLEMKKISS